MAMYTFCYDYKKHCIMSDAESGLLAFFPLPLLLPRAVLCSVPMLLSGLLLPLKPHPPGVSVNFLFLCVYHYPYHYFPSLAGSACS